MCIPFPKKRDWQRQLGEADNIIYVTFYIRREMPALETPTWPHIVSMAKNKTLLNILLRYLMQIFELL